MSESKCEVLKAVNEMMKRIEGVKKEKKQGVPFDIVSYDTLLELIRDDIIELGLVMSPVTCTQVNNTSYEQQTKSGVRRMTSDNFVFTFKLYHVSSGEYLDIAIPSVGIDDQDKGPGKAVTYAAKSAWLQVLMLKRGKEFDSASKGNGEREYSSSPVTEPSKPQTSKPQTSKPQYTNDPSTWPPRWRDDYAKTLANVQAKDDLEDAPEVPWVAQMHALEKYLRSNQCPPEILAPYMCNITVWLLKTLLETRHAMDAGMLAQTHFDQLCRWVGTQTAEVIKSKMTTLF